MRDFEKSAAPASQLAACFRAGLLRELFSRGLITAEQLERLLRLRRDL